MYRPVELRRNLWRWGLATTVAAILVFHFLMTAVYLSPPNLLKRDLGRLAWRYMSPLFYQNWHLFSPNPGISSTKLAIRCWSPDTGWGEWRDPLAELYPKHYRWRISGYGKVIYIYRDVGLSLNRLVREKLVECLERHAARPEEVQRECSEQRIAPRLHDEPAFALSVRLAARTCESAGPMEDRVQRLQFKVVEFFPRKFSERNQMEKLWSEVRELEFAPLDLRPASGG